MSNKNLLWLFLISVVGFVGFIFYVSRIGDEQIQSKQLKDSENRAKTLLNLLQTSAALYSAQQKASPQQFSDFVAVEGMSGDYHTITLNHVQDLLDMPERQVNIEGNKMEVCFPETGLTANYYLNDIDVTLDISR